ncbi:MAG: glycoside hydrolase family 31 protein, partial [Lachnospiraceae bacterium]|nr:glycoside hydrolase family 31 protein [Lachnospiraceae bacterium]
ENEVWSYGEENYDIMLKFIHIREMMRDYTRNIMKEAHETGAPVMRALFYEFPEDGVCWEIKDAYMFGSDILVAPICYEKAAKRMVYLPVGASFVHAGSGRWYEGGKWYEIEADIHTIPIFLKEGRQEYLIGKI